MNDDLLNRFMKRGDHSPYDQYQIHRPRFSIVHKIQHMDDGDVLQVALFDGMDIIDCQRYWLPRNLTSETAVNRWGNARIQEFQKEIIDVLGV